MQLDDPFAEWIPLTAQVPRKDQSVRVMTIGGIEHRAMFTVAYTTVWPEGASWMPTKDEQVLPFWDVWLWSPNPDASAPTLEEAWTPEPAAPVVAATLAEEDIVHHPAVPTAILDEIGRGKSLLARLPEDGLGWSPQPSIATLGALASRAVRVLERIQWILEIDETERTLEPPPVQLETAKDIQDAYANGAKPVRAALESVGEEALDETWTISYKGRPRVQIRRSEALLVYGLRPLVAVCSEMSFLLRALGQSVEHPTPEWPFGDEPETDIAPEFFEDEVPAVADDHPDDDDPFRDDQADRWTHSQAGKSFNERFRIRADRARRA